ncbi:MAG TPA: carboxypeptidase M32 [Puia sp.]|jgi:carboxypeptidase Taq|nr:carboxypeptidase M32 [Puia sp.]
MISIPTQDLYTTYVDRMQKIADIKYSAAVLEWDQETYLPPKGAAARSRQLASLSEIAHEWLTAPGLGELMQELSQRGDLDEDQRRNIELSLEDFNKQKKFSPAFIRRLSETSSRAFHSWIQARAANSFKLFQADLQQLVTLKKEEAELAGYRQHPYNALLDNFEKGCTTALLDQVFGTVRAPLKDILDRIAGRPQVDDSFLHGDYPRSLQWNFGLDIIQQLGFDFEAGRQDISEHPFTTSFNARDVRITTRIDENNFNNMTWSCIHETGHALYEQGLPPENYGLPLGEFASLSIHESQSRLWENNVGRSLAWWKPIYPRLQAIFPDRLGGVTVEQFYAAINKVAPSLIRTEADEVSYHFHVMIRYELEKRLIEGSLPVADIPAWWKENYAAWLGVDVPDDKNGCLQDVHWSHGSFGYFPTYSLGSFYAAQFYESAVNQYVTIDQGLCTGNTAPLLAWLRTHIHRHGRRYPSEQLCQIATGKGLDIRYFLDYLLNKYVIIYDFLV